MQPPNRPHAPHPAHHRQRGDEADLYRQHHAGLQRAIAGAVNASPALIEDACQTAWTKFLRRQPNRQTAFGWLYVVALHEAYRLSAIQRREQQRTELTPDLNVDNTIPDRVTLDDQLQAREGLRALAQLPEPQRRDLALLIAGYSYRDIAQITGGRTYNNVNKHLVKARARIRQYQSDDTTGEARP